MADDNIAPQKRGRPPKPKSEVKRAPLNMRTTPEARRKLEDAADKSGRSLAQEVEYRIERSFFYEDTLSLSGPDPKTSKFVRDSLDLKRITELTIGADTWEDYETWVAWKAAISILLDYYQPKKEKLYKDQHKHWEKLHQEWSEEWGGLLAPGWGSGKEPVAPPISPMEKAAIAGRAATITMLANKFKELDATLAGLEQKSGELALEEAKLRNINKEE